MLGTAAGHETSLVWSLLVRFMTISQFQSGQVKIIATGFSVCGVCIRSPIRIHFIVLNYFLVGIRNSGLTAASLGMGWKEMGSTRNIDIA